MIACQDVHKSYRLGDRDVTALCGVTLTIAEPGFYAIMGQSGSGKSTLLYLLGALDRPTSGTISIAGRAIHSLSDREATEFRRTSVGMVFQQFNLIATLSARENVELPGLLAGQKRAWLSERSGMLLERLGLSDRADHRPDAMSGGEQQRVAIARALLYRPPLLLADEPTGNLDSASSERLWSLLAEIAREQETTVVMVTHEPAAATHCRRVFVIRDGAVLGEMETEGLDAGRVASGYTHLVGSPLA
ncbi:MAG: ABC transporter ATP-binding protein [Phycisphaeraceae bacterium]|nr:ABC transporter ATP-binding protein [Phycisphaeraceae bacterium]MCW5763415.1 ABC transporter ATP-binding protein [Phycisphaeraceae bacterium]